MLAGASTRLCMGSMSSDGTELDKELASEGCQDGRGALQRKRRGGG